MKVTRASEIGSGRSSKSEQQSAGNRGNRQEKQFVERALRIAYGTLVRSSLPFSSIQLLRQSKAQESRLAWLQQKRGIYKTERPEGSLIWVHTEETSEVTSVIALVRRLATACATSRFLITTADTPGFEFDAESEQAPILQAVAPHAQPGWINRFLDHWRPNGAIFFSSMPNPGYSLAARDRNIPLLMINGTMSLKTYKKWRYYPGLIGPALREFSVVLAPTRAEGARLRRLGAQNVVVSGSLKYDGQLATKRRHPEPELIDAVAGRKIWVAACATIYETLTAIEVHKALRQNHEDLLTFISPAGMTHSELNAVLDAAGLVSVRADEACTIGRRTDIYIPATDADLCSLFSLADVAFVGGTETHENSADPIAAASVGAVVLHGPHMHRYQKAVSDLQAAGASQMVRDAVDLSRSLDRLLATPDLLRQRSIAGQRVAEAETKVVDHIMSLMNRELRRMTAQT